MDGQKLAALNKTRTKKDWSGLKTKFLMSEKSLDDFLKDNGINYYSSSYAVQQTRTWYAERDLQRQLTAQIVSKAMENRLTAQIEQMQEARIKLLDKISRTIEEYSDNQIKLSAGDVKTYWEILRTEVNLPTTVTKTTNENRQIDFTFISNLTAQNSPQEALPSGNVVDIDPPNNEATNVK
jgi:hypothetical protein